VDRSRVMKTGGLRIVDGNLDSVKAHIFAGAGSEWKRADEDAAVALLADLEIERKLEVVMNLVVNQHVPAAFVRIDGPFLDRPLTGLLAAGHPALERLAVENQRPAGLLLGVC